MAGTDMVNLYYNRLFNLRLSHDFYENGNARGIILTPAARTRRVLKGGNMLLKALPNGITVLYRTEDDGVTPLVELPPDLTLTFSIRAVQRAEFLNITDLDESPSKKYGASNLLYFANDPSAASSDPENPEPITHVLIDSLRDPLFTYEFTLDPAPSEVLLRVRNAVGDLVAAGKRTDGSPLPTTLTVEKEENNLYKQQIDLREQPPGTYNLTVRNTGDTENLKEEQIYIDREFASRDLMGVLDIVYESGTDQLYGNTEEFEIQFSRKETIWKYFIVKKKRGDDLSGDLITIEDIDIVDNGSPDYTTTAFSRQGGSDPVTSVNGLEAVIFTSDDPIPFYEVPKSAVQLKISDDDTVLIEHLPNPSRNGSVKDRGGTLESEIYVFI